MNYMGDAYISIDAHRRRVAASEKAWQQYPHEWPRPAFLTWLGHFFQILQHIRRIRIEISLEIQPANPMPKRLATR